MRQRVKTRINNTALFAVLALIIAGTFAYVGRGEPEPLGDTYYTSHYGDWRKIRGEGVRVRASEPVMVSKEEIYVLVEIQNVRGAEARLARFDVAGYTSIDIVNGGVEEYTPMCSGRYSCDSFENMDPGETVRRAVGFQTGDTRGRLEMGFYGGGWTRVVEFKEG